MHDFLERVGRFSARRHWVVFVAWLIILGALVGLRSAYGGEFYNNYTVPGSESSQGLDLLQKDFPTQGGYAGQIVFHAKTGSLADQAASIDTAMANVAKLPDVIAATNPLTSSPPRVSQDGTIASGAVSWNVAPASLEKDYLKKLDTAIAPARAAGLQVEYGAGAGQIGQQTDDTKSEIIGLVCALLLLFFMFWSIAAALIPLISAVFSVLAGLSLVGLLAAATNFPTTAPTVATLLGLGVAIDYGLFLVARHRENVDHGMDVNDSAGNATSTSGGAVVVAGGTVVVAILGLYVSGVPFIGAMGLAAAIVVAVTILAALTLTPAFMGVTKGNVRALGKRRRARSADEAAHEHSAFARWGKMVSGRPWPWAIAAAIVLCILAIPLFAMRLGQLDAGTNPTTQSSRRAYDLVSEGFGPGANGPLTVVVSLPSQSQQDNQTLLTNVQSSLAKTSGVASVTPPSVNDAGTTAVLNVVPTTSPQDAATSALVDNLRDSVLPSFHARTYVVGTTAGYVDFTEQTSKRMVWLILAVVLLAFVLLTVAFRSVVIATKAGLLNLISVGAAYGVVVAIFQWQWGSELIGIHESLPIPAFVPMLMFAIVFGLSMDYEVFLMSRVHEAWMQSKDAHRSVAIGIGSTARVITTAAAIMVVVFLSFVLSTDPTVKMLAVGMAAAVLIDASIIRMILVPAVMALLGKWAWWMPRWLDRITPHIDIEGSGTETLPQNPAPSPEKEPPAPVTSVG
ncbi:RND superfamily putative drug exporter [Antricoccus suffuscus]|uniref:RND superfamily putative drug exporter n=1 Tax=Antricoccus suffuscus TaxID=1629062 RepID=A0A2T1A065_9ACTN|nr:MMPL family transporter [Antricoccus suffuscus]PRZ41999.1 RND superfamily putative drug exporter [Antricoccus suffuscus]